MSTGLHGRFLRGLSLGDGGIAVRAGGRDVSYAEMHERALSWAAWLRAGPVEQDRPAIGVLGNRTVEAYTAVLAALYCGGTVVPLHPRFPVARNRAALLAAGVSAVIADPDGAGSLTTLLDGLPRVRALVPGDRAQDGPGLAEPLPAAPGDTAYVLFTSGSTGRPKGVRVSHGGTGHYFDLVSRRYDFTPADRFSQIFDLTFDCAMFDLFAAWDAGAGVVPLPSSALLRAGDALGDAGITVWFSTPSAIAYARKVGGLAPGVLPALRWSLFAGEALTVADAADWQRAAPASVLENLYGPTELTVTVSAHRFDPDRSAGLAVNGVVPIGSVHSGHDVLLLGPDGRPAEEGELCVAGPQLTPGYLDPADGAGRFLDRDGRRYYRTGDRVRPLGDGELAYLGRLDSQVQLQGWRVELAEVEHCLRGCDGVQDAVALVVDQELVVFYTGRQVPAMRLVGQLRQVLPEPMIPRRYRHLEHWPLNPNRKIDRPALASLASPG